MSHPVIVFIWTLGDALGVGAAIAISCYLALGWRRSRR